MICSYKIKSGLLLKMAFLSYLKWLSIKGEGVHQISCCYHYYYHNELLWATVVCAWTIPHLIWKSNTLCQYVNILRICMLFYDETTNCVNSILHSSNIWQPPRNVSYFWQVLIPFSTLLLTHLEQILGQLLKLRSALKAPR